MDRTQLEIAEMVAEMKSLLLSSLAGQMEASKLIRFKNIKQALQDQGLDELGQPINPIIQRRALRIRARAESSPVAEPEITPTSSPEGDPMPDPISPGVLIKAYAKIQAKANKCLAELASLERQYDNLQARIDQRRVLTEEKLRKAYAEWHLRNGQRQVGPSLPAFNKSIYDVPGIMSILSNWDRATYNHYLTSALNKQNGSPKWSIFDAEKLKSED